MAKPSTRKNTVSAHLSVFRRRRVAFGIGPGEPAPLDRQPVEADAAVQLDREQQQEVERPEVAGPDAVGRLERADQLGMRQHRRRGAATARKNSAKPVSTCQNQSVVSSCCSIFMWPRNGRELAVVDRELAHGEERVHDDQRDDAGDDDRDDAPGTSGRRRSSPRRTW